MENEIKYIKVSAENPQLCEQFETLMLSYIAEMNEHSHRPLPEQFQKKWIDSIRAMQGPSDRHLELCYVAGAPIGFLYGKLDHADHKGYIRTGYGYIMEFYIMPEYRRKGFGKTMFHRLERLLYNDGAKMMYLTADPVTGKPFWEAMGFMNTGEQSPENQLDIYEKAIGYLAFENCNLCPLTKETVNEISQWEYAPPYDAYSYNTHHDAYLLDESTWGTEQFCLIDNGVIIGQVACQYEADAFWVGWSMAPQFCGRGRGAAFVDRCVREIRRIKSHSGRILLRVSARNLRAIRAYQKAGFRYVETIQDEIAYSDHIEDFWVMEL